MKDGFLRRINPKQILLLLMVLQCAVTIFWAGKREAFFWDEYASFEGARSDYTHLYERADYYEQWHNRVYLIWNSTLHENELYINKPVSEFIYHAGYEEWYYILLNLVYSFTPEVFTGWPATILNVLCMALTTLIIYKISKELAGDEMKALIPAGIWGLTIGAVKLTFLLRTYMVGTLLLVLFFGIQLMAIGRESIRSHVCIFVVSMVMLYVGYRFQPLMTAIMGLSYGLLIIVALVHHRKQYVCVNLIGIIAASVLGSRLILSKLTKIAKSGGYISEHAIESIRDHDMKLILHDTLINKILATVYRELFASPFGITIAVISVLLIVGFIRFYRDGNRIRRHYGISICVAGLASTVLYLLFLSVIFAGWRSWRYYMPFYPFIICFLITMIIILYDGSTHSAISAGILIFSMCLSLLYSHIVIRPDLLYDTSDEIRESLGTDHAGTDGVIYGDGPHFYEAAYLWPDEHMVYTPSGPESMIEMMNGYEGNKLILYVNTPIAEETISKIETETPFKNSELLFEYPDTNDGLEIYELSAE